MTEPNDRHPLGRAAAFVIALTGLWLLAGAVFKLFWGSPNLLPQVVRDVPLALGTTYRLAIAAELVLAMLALFKPKWGWPLLVGALLLFDVILTLWIVLGAILEERDLVAEFGEEYARYRRHVPMLVPWRLPWTP